MCFCLHDTRGQYLALLKVSLVWNLNFLFVRRS